MSSLTAYWKSKRREREEETSEQAHAALEVLVAA